MQSYIKIMSCSPISMRVSRMNNQLQLVYSAVMTFTVTGRLLFSPITHKTASNDKVNFTAGEREGALGYNEWRVAA